MELIEKVKRCLVVIDNYVSVDYIEAFFGEDSDFEQIKEKINNFNNIISKMNDVEFDTFCQKDWETEIWPLINFCNN